MASTTAPVRDVLPPIGGNTTLEELERAARLLGMEGYGRWGAFGYAGFDWINAALFGGELPTPLILWTITPYGHCLGLTHADPSAAAPPIVQMHPALLAPAQENPWEVPTGWLGYRWYALDVLIHECVHVAVERRRGGHTGESSHNSPEWVAELNRLAPLLGLDDFRAGLSRVKRVPVEGRFTRTGRPLTRLKRVSEATWRGAPINFKAVSEFPGWLREATGQADAYYRGSALPFGDGWRSAPHAGEGVMT